MEPGKHMISTRDHSWGPQDEPVARPVPFTDMVAELRRGLADDPGRPAGISRAQASAAAGLLAEFAARLRLDRSRTVVDDSAEQLAGLADELADQLRHPGATDDDRWTEL